MAEDILLDRDGHVCIITINRPHVMISLDFGANEKLVEAWRTFSADPELRVALITGSGGKAFCAGADLKTYTMSFATTPAPEFQRKYTNGPGLGGITRNLHVFKPILAAIEGYAISGGFEIALACDIRFCSDRAKFGLQDVKWGFHACDGGLIRLREIVGRGNAMEMILSGDLIDADHALRIGLVNRICRKQDLFDESLAYAHHLATRAPLAQQLAKEVMVRAEGLNLDEALRLESTSFHGLGKTRDLAEGTTAFREKRDAKFVGE